MSEKDHFEEIKTAFKRIVGTEASDYSIPSATRVEKSGSKIVLKFFTSQLRLEAYYGEKIVKRLSDHIKTGGINDVKIEDNELFSHSGDIFVSHSEKVDNRPILTVTVNNDEKDLEALRKAAKAAAISTATNLIQETKREAMEGLDGHSVTVKRAAVKGLPETRHIIAAKKRAEQIIDKTLP